MKRATDNGIFHRDIKPTNIIVHDNVGYLIDWGIATTSSQVDKGKLSATLAFASMDVLNSIRTGESYSYSIKDEIESIFYTLVYILCDGDLRWKVTGSITEMYDSRYVTVNKHFEEQLLCAPEECRPILDELHQRVFTNESKGVQVDEIIKCFNDKLRDV